jgi:hypothetical protein
VRGETSKLRAFRAFRYKLRTSAGARQKRVGCDIFWRMARFECLYYLDDWQLVLNDISDDVRLSPLLEPKDVGVWKCVSAIVCLRDFETGHRFVITSSHLLWDPCFVQIELAHAFGVREVT